jgi:hypothetical protein
MYNFYMTKKIKIVLLVSVLVLVVGGSITIAALSIYKPDVIKRFFNKPYSAVYLSSGEMYIGKLSTFPNLVLTNIYLFKIVPDPSDATKKAYQLVPLKNTPWSPDKIYLNKDQVIFTAPIRDDSQVAQALKGK